MCVCVCVCVRVYVCVCVCVCVPVSYHMSSNIPISVQVLRVRWDSSQVNKTEVHEVLPTLLRLDTVKPCLLVLDNAWDIEQVCIISHGIK